MSLLTHRRALLSAKGGLPSAYQQVEYLESTGTQYINTKVYPTINTKVILDMQITGHTNNNTGYDFIFGTRNTDTNRRVELLFYSYNYNLYANIGEDLTNRVINNVPQNLKRHIYTVDCRTTEVIMDNSILLSTCGGLESLKSFYQPIRLFGATFGATMCSKIKLYAIEFYEANKCVANFIPCYRKVDNKAGLYDLVNGEFYTNKGTGEFILGGEV